MKKKNEKRKKEAKTNKKEVTDGKQRPCPLGTW